MSASLVAIAVVSLFLEPSELAAQLRPMLAEELGKEVIVESRAKATMELSLALAKGGGELALRLARTSGETILERNIAIVSDNRKAALRIAAVAVEEAITAELELQKAEAARLAALAGAGSGAGTSTASGSGAAATSSAVPAAAKTAGGGQASTAVGATNNAGAAANNAVGATNNARAAGAGTNNAVGATNNAGASTNNAGAAANGAGAGTNGAVGATTGAGAATSDRSDANASRGDLGAGATSGESLASAARDDGGASGAPRDPSFDPPIGPSRSREISIDPRDSLAPSVAANPFPLWIGISAGAAWIEAPQAVLEVTGRHPIAFFDAGITIAGTGLAGASLEQPLMNGQPGLIGSLQIFEALALVAWTPFTPNIFDLDLHLGFEAGAGACFQSLSADPTAFRGPSPARSDSSWGPAGRASAIAILMINPSLRARLQAGSTLRPVLRAELPDGFSLGSARLESGPFSPYIALGVELSPF